MKIHHVGYLVKNIDKSLTDFVKLGYKKESEIIHDEFRKINICFLVNGDYRIEFVEPTEECEFLKNLIKKIGVGTYHLCYESDDFEKDVKNLTENGYIIAQEKAEAVAIDKKNVVFLYSRNAGLIEIIDNKRN